MTQIFKFVPPPDRAFQFSPVMDGQSCTGVVTWNLFGNRWYLNLLAADGSLIFNLPLIGSPPSVYLQSVNWSHGYVNAVTAMPHEWLNLATVDLLITQCAPVEYNGNVRAFVTGPTTIQWPLANNPGPIQDIGVADFTLNMAGGYFLNSTLVYRELLQQIEVSP
jgi:hypothetical protein